MAAGDGRGRFAAPGLPRLAALPGLGALLGLAGPLGLAALLGVAGPLRAAAPMAPANARIAVVGDDALVATVRAGLLGDGYTLWPGAAGATHTLRVARGRDGVVLTVEGDAPVRVEVAGEGSLALLEMLHRVPVLLRRTPPAETTEPETTEPAAARAERRLRVALSVRGVDDRDSASTTDRLVAALLSRDVAVAPWAAAAAHRLCVTAAGGQLALSWGPPRGSCDGRAIARPRDDPPLLIVDEALRLRDASQPEALVRGGSSTLEPFALDPPPSVPTAVGAAAATPAPDPRAPTGPAADLVGAPGTAREAAAPATPAAALPPGPAGPPALTSTMTPAAPTPAAPTPAAPTPAAPTPASPPSTTAPVNAERAAGGDAVGLRVALGALGSAGAPPGVQAAGLVGVAAAPWVTSGSFSLRPATVWLIDGALADGAWIAEVAPTAGLEVSWSAPAGEARAALLVGGLVHGWTYPQSDFGVTLSPALLVPLTARTALGATAVEATLLLGAARPIEHEVDGALVWSRGALFVGVFVGIDVL